MRTIWSALVVLVLLVPFGGVGITSTPIDAEIVASPRDPSLAKLRIESELPPVLAVAPVVLAAPVVRVRVPSAASSSSPLLVSDRHPSAGPRDPPV